MVAEEFCVENFFPVDNSVLFVFLQEPFSHPDSLVQTKILEPMSCFFPNLLNQKPVSAATSSKKQESVREEEEEGVKEDVPKKVMKEKLKEV